MTADHEASRDAACAETHGDDPTLGRLLILDAVTLHDSKLLNRINRSNDEPHPRPALTWSRTSRTGGGRDQQVQRNHVSSLRQQPGGFFGHCGVTS